jgi:hypothetical protein
MRLLAIAIVLGVLNAHATQKIEAGYKTSDQSTSENLGYKYYGDEDDSIWSTNVDFTSTRSKVNDLNKTDTEVTRDLQWTNTWDITKSWSVDFDIGGSNTRVNHIRTTNADLTVGNTQEDWNYFNWSVTSGLNSIKQTVRKKAATNGLELEQSKIGAQIGVDPFEWMTMSLYADKYSYDKNVDQEITYLQNQAAIRKYAMAFSDEVSSLMEQEAGMSFIFRMTKTWKLTVSGGESEDAPSPHVKGTSASLRLYHKFNSQWDGSATVGSNHYDSTSQTPATNYGFVGINAGFSW